MPSYPRPKKVLAIQFKQIGDSVLVVPSLRAIRRQWPECELHVVVFDNIAELIRPIPWINQVWGISKSKSPLSIFRTFRMLFKLRNMKFCRSVDFGGNDRGAWFGFFIRAKLRLGPKKKKKTGAFHISNYGYNQTIAQKYEDYYQASVLASVLRAWGVSPDDMNLELQVGNESPEKESLDLPRKFICLHLTTARNVKNWPVSKWSHLHDLLCERKIPVVVSAGSSREERQIAKCFSDASPNAMVLHAFDTIHAFLGFIRHARLLVCGDSAPVHIAAALGVSTLTLFGPTDHVLWKPRGRHFDINARCACKTGKTFDPCKMQSICMDSISAIEVLDMTIEILKGLKSPTT